jgi:ZIP family zinc transporter
MGFAETVLLGAIAGLTIFVGLPLGRASLGGERLRVALAMLSVGILAFIFMDVTSAAEGILTSALHDFRAHRGSFGHLLALFALLAVGFTAGTAGIAGVQRAAGRSAGPAIAGASAELTLSVAERAVAELQARRATLRTGMTIAAAIGLHNFAEGLAIGVSARAAAIGLATVLIIGFGLHNATEGFGIVGPLGRTRPSWGWLGLAGLVGGGPTFFGTLVGYQVNSAALELCFYALAGGAIIYVIGEVWTGVRRHGHRLLGLNLLAAGFLLGIATDLIVTYGGA